MTGQTRLISYSIQARLLITFFKQLGHFAHFGLQSGMVFEGTTECMNVFIVSIPDEQARKRNMRIRNGFEEFFVFALTAK